MLNLEAFSNCIRENLKDRRFGKERADEVIQKFEDRAKVHVAAGRTETDAALLAMRDTFDSMAKDTAERVKRTAAQLAAQAAHNDRIAQGLKTDLKLFDAGRAEGQKKTSRGEALAHAAVSLIESDQRFKGTNYLTDKTNVIGEANALWDSGLSKIGKGRFGVQRGVAYLDNIIREIKGENTGDVAAKELAGSWLKISDYLVDRFNEVGGSMGRLPNYIPQKVNAARLFEMGRDEFAKLYSRLIDWDKTRWPDGSLIDPGDRARLLIGGKDEKGKHTFGVFDTMTTDGATKLDPTSFRGNGRAAGNMLDDHRFFHFKDAASWLEVHSKLGDGNAFEVMMHHIEGMAHKIALVKTFGPNPEMASQNIAAIVRKKAAALGGVEANKASAFMKNRFDPMIDMVLRSNPMDPHSNIAAFVGATSNVLNAAQGGSIALSAIPGDFMTSAAVKSQNNFGAFNGLGFAMKAFFTHMDWSREALTNAGFVVEGLIRSTYGHQRFGAFATVGPHITRRLSDLTMRGTMLSGLTDAQRMGGQVSAMNTLHNFAGREFEGLPIKHVFDRYGITKEDWDVFRKEVPAYFPKPDWGWRRPLDILKAEHVQNRRELFDKFQGMVLRESRDMVPDTTLAGSVMLKGTSRPDTIRGAVLHSFAMYKNFAVSGPMLYARRAMTSPSVKGRLGTIAGLTAAMTVAGAVALQLKELRDGRDLLPMDNPSFWPRAALAGGGAGIAGDFLTAGVNRFGKGPAETASGPLFGALGDTTQLVFGDMFAFANNVGSLDEGVKTKSQTPQKLLEYVKRYNPLSNLWWAKLALNREVFDRMQELADPKIYQKRRNQERAQRKQYGNEYWWAPGAREPERLPQYKGN